MCVIVHKPAGSALPRAVVERSFKANPHGFGLAWTEKDKSGRDRWFFVRGMTLQELLDACEKYVTEENVAVMHCRIASKGEVSLENTHPFRIKRHAGLLMHNGTLSLTPVTKGGTDSETLAEWFSAIRNLPTLLQDKQWVDAVEEFIFPSKVVVMTVADGKAQVTIFNEAYGETRGKLWASNDSAFGAEYRKRKDRKRDKWRKSYTPYVTPNLIGATTQQSGTIVPFCSQSANTTTAASDFEKLKALADNAGDFDTWSWSEGECAPPIEGPPYTECMNASDYIEKSDSFIEVERKVREHPEEAAKALWYYRLLCGVE